MIFIVSKLNPYACNFKQIEQATQNSLIQQQH